MFFDSVYRPLIANASPVVRAYAMRSAGRAGWPTVTQFLIDGLADSVEAVRAEAAFGLGETSDTARRSVIAAALAPFSRLTGEAAVEAIAALGKLGGAEARVHVEHALRTRTSGPEVKEALLAIWRFPRLPATSALLRPFMSSDDPEIRWRTIYALTRGGPDPANIELFQRSVRDSEVLVRAFGVRGLRAATADSAGQRAQSAMMLSSALGDPHPHVRINAVGVLGGYRDQAHAQRAVLLLNDADLNVRMAAAQALGQMRGGVAAAALEARIRDASERPALRGVALASLVLADPIRGLGLASEFADSSNWLLRMYAARALAGLRTAESLALLRRLANDRAPLVAGPAVAATAAIAGDTLQSVRALFIERLAATDPFVRAEALRGLRRIAQAGDEAIAFEAFGRAQRDTIPEAAIAALDLLGKLGENNPAVINSFWSRFPPDSIRLEEVRAAIGGRLRVTYSCCARQPRPDVYERVVRTVLVPALNGSALPRVRITTSAGAFDVELLARDAPMTVDNVLSLARRGYFNGARWHRVVPNFVLQDGDPTGTGSGGPGYAIVDEINRVRYLRGMVGMALSGPNTGGSQFFVTHSPQPHLDGGYTVFGRVVTGMDVADRVVQDDPIISIEVIE